MIWPVIIGYFHAVRMLADWCALRGDFRHFHTDRIMAADFLDEPHGLRRTDLQTRWRQARESKSGR